MSTSAQAACRISLTLALSSALAVSVPAPAAGTTTGSGPCERLSGAVTVTPAGSEATLDLPAALRGRDLSAQDVTVTQDGLDVPVLRVSPAAPEATDVAVVLDTSARASGLDVESAARGLLTSLPRRSSVSVVTAGDQPTVAWRLAAGPRRALAALTGLLPGGRAALVDAVALAIGQLPGDPTRHQHVVVVAAGPDEASARTWPGVRRELRGRGVGLEVVRLAGGPALPGGRACVGDAAGDPAAAGREVAATIADRRRLLLPPLDPVAPVLVTVRQDGVVASASLQRAGVASALPGTTDPAGRRDAGQAAADGRAGVGTLAVGLVGLALLVLIVLVVLAGGRRRGDATAGGATEEPAGGATEEPAGGATGDRDAARAAPAVQHPGSVAIDLREHAMVGVSPAASAPAEPSPRRDRPPPRPEPAAQQPEPPVRVEGAQQAGPGAPGALPVPQADRAVRAVVVAALPGAVVVRTALDPSWWTGSGFLGIVAMLLAVTLAGVGSRWVWLATQPPRALLHRRTEQLRAAALAHEDRVARAAELLQRVRGPREAQAWEEFERATGLAVPATVRRVVDPGMEPAGLVRFLAARQSGHVGGQQSLVVVTLVPVLLCLLPAIALVAML